MWVPFRGIFQGLGFKVQGWGPGFGVFKGQDRVWGSGFGAAGRIQSLGSGVPGLGLKCIMRVTTRVTKGSQYVYSKGCDRV